MMVCSQGAPGADPGTRRQDQGRLSRCRSGSGRRPDGGVRPSWGGGAVEAVRLGLVPDLQHRQALRPAVHGPPGHRRPGPQAEERARIMEEARREAENTLHSAAGEAVLSAAREAVRRRGADDAASAEWAAVLLEMVRRHWRQWFVLEPLFRRVGQ